MYFYVHFHTQSHYATDSLVYKIFSKYQSPKIEVTHSYLCADSERDTLYADPTKRFNIINNTYTTGNVQPTSIYQILRLLNPRKIYDTDEKRGIVNKAVESKWQYVGEANLRYDSAV